MILSPAAIDVLSESTITGNMVHLPPRQLDSKLYVEVNAALTRLGGQWNRRHKAHVFSQDPTGDIAVVLESGRMPVDADKLASFFRTPQRIAEQMANWIGGGVPLPFGTQILEPSAGDGAIAAVVLDRHPAADVMCVEPDLARFRLLESNGFMADAITFQQFAAEAHQRGELWDVVVMNPPLTEPGKPMAWVEHVTLAWGLLAPGGRLAAVVPISIEHSTRRAVCELRDLLAGHGTWEMLPEGSFKESGTSVRTAVILATKGDR